MILVYEDEGVSPGAYKQLLSALQGYPFSSINARSLIHHSWGSSAKVLIFPGGRDLPYHQALQGPGNAKIRSFVEAGGNYFGICAGAYYGCAQIEFEKGEKLEVIGSRELAFFPGKAIGSAYEKGLYQYGSERGALAAPISWEKGVDSVYFNGGCLFDSPEKYPHVEVLGRYHDLPHHPAALICCQIGLGKVYLSGVHPEYSPESPLWNHLINLILT